ncbi:MAG: dephospho-CoA kinase [Traorella sp.]
MSKSKKKTWIAISGTMGSGKSTVLKYLKEKGYHVFDCDKINYDLQQKDALGYSKIIDTFGKEILDENQAIDRKKLASIVFSNQENKEKLEQIMHPLILQKLNEIHEQNKESCFVEVPLLYELGWERYFEDDWLIVSSNDNLFNRCRINRNMNDQMIQERLRYQMIQDEKIKKASQVIYNNDSLDSLYQKIDQLLERINNE